jgi:hypothetical protein
MRYRVYINNKENIYCLDIKNILFLVVLNSILKYANSKKVFILASYTLSN